MKIAICDDQNEIRELLSENISALFPEDTIALYETGEALLDADEEPDILLLDIKLPGVSGMDIAKRIRMCNKKMIIIFITGEEQYVYDSFDVGAFHFLVKPFSMDKLKAVLMRAKAQCADSDEAVKKHYTIINSGGFHVRLCLDDVIYAEVFNSKVLVHTIDEDIAYYGNLTDLEKIAGAGFFRTHRAFLVNMKHVVKYDAANVYFEKGSAIMSKKNYPLFVKALMRFNSES